MSVYCIVNSRQKLHDPTRKIFLNEPLQYDNAQAHCFRLTLTADDGTSPADLSDVSVVANFMRPDGGTVEIAAGTPTGNVVEVILPAACYASVGRYKLTVNLVEGSGESAAARTAMIVEGITERNTSGTPVDPGTIMPSINDLIQEIDDAMAEIEPEYTNLVNGVVRHDMSQSLTVAQKAQARGNIAAADAALVNCEEITIETSGYITTAVAVGDTVNLTPATSSTTKHAILDCNPGDQFTICGCGGVSTPAYAFIDANNVLLAVGGPQAAYNYYVVTAPANTAKVILQNNSTVMAIQSQYKGVYIPETLDRVASAATPRVPPMRWINGGVTSSGFDNSATNKRSAGITFRPGEHLIVSNTNKDVDIAVYGAKNNVFKLVGGGYVQGGARVELQDWEYSYYIRLRPHTGSTRPDPETGGYISVIIEPADVPYDGGYYKWCSYPQIGLHRTYSNVKPILTFERKTITTAGIEDSSTDCLVSLPNCGWVEVKQDANSVQFKIAKVTDGVITFPVDEWSYYSYRYWGDGASDYYALVTKSPGASESSDIMVLARKYLAVYLFTDEGAAYEHGYSLSGKHLAFIGDSITQGRFDKDGDASHALETTTSKSFCELVAEIAGDDDVGNYGIGGALVANTEGSPWKSLLTNCGKVSGYDVVFVCGGTNDYGNNVAEADFRSAYTTVVETLMANNTEVICCTPVYRTSKLGANSQGLWLVDYAAIIREIAEAKGIMCIDLLALTSDGCFTRFCPDGLHPNEMGHKVMADWIVSECDRMKLL